MNNFTYIILIYLLMLEVVHFSVETDVNPDDGNYMSIKKLRTKLFTNYNKTERPVQLHSNTTSVNFTFANMYAFDYDERNETLTVDGYFRLRWVDSRWIWNPNEYGGLKRLVVAKDEVWLPDIGIYESVPAQKLTNIMTHNPIAFSSGTIIWLVRGVFKTLCPFKMDNYPRNTQTCNMTFGSWTEDGLSLDLQVEYLQRAYKFEPYNINNQWKLVDLKESRSINYRTEMANPFVNAIATIKIQRSLPIENKVIAPSVIVATILMLSMFWLPPSSEKKLTLGGSALFMLLGLLLYVAASVRSPLVISVAVSPVRSVIFITITALLSEIVVIIISKLIMSPPPNLKNLVDGKIGKILVLNSPILSACNEQLQVQEKSGPEDTWYKTAMAADRFFFLLFAIICILNQIL